MMILKSAAEETKHWDETLDVEFEIKEVSENGVFTGYGSTFGNVDRDRDVMAKGAFTKSLKKKLTDIKLLWQHNPQEPIGVWEEIREDDKGLFVKGRLLIGQNVPFADKAYALMKAGAINSMSIGFAIPNGAYEIDQKKRVRIIKEADLWEVSVVTFPANPKATVRRVKSVVPYQDLPLADRGRPWDSSAAESRIRQTAGGASSVEDMDWEKYRKGFLWYDADNPEEIGSYKLPFADVINGDLVAVPRGIFAAAGAMLGARGGVDIPENQQSGIISNIERYYSKMDLESPFKMIDMGDAVKSYVSALLNTANTEREFERTLRDVGFAKTDAKAIASKIEPRWDAGDDDIDAKFKQAADLLKFTQN